MKIYVDEIFAVNALTQLLMLYSYSILTGKRKRHWRIAAASALGGIYAAAEAAFALPHLLRAPLLALLVRIAFGRGGVLLCTARMMLMILIVEGLTITAASFYGGSAVLTGGVVTLFASGPLTAAVYLLSYPAVIFCKRTADRKKRRRKVFIRYEGRTVEFDALYDSGNLLKYHGRPVILTDRRKGMELSGYESYERLRENAGAFVMYGTIGGSGVLPVLDPVECRIDGEKTEAAVAVAEKEFRGKYQGIVGEI